MPAKTTQPSEDLNNPYGYSDMDWAAQLDPASAAARAEVRRLSVGEDGTLSVTVKALIVIGVFASRGLQYGVEVDCRTSLSCISKEFGGFCSPLWRLRTGQL